MRIIETVAELRAAIAAAHEGPVGFVPTMGALHEGHLSLMRRARAETGLVVVSVFVNPTQFNDRHDLAAYPRDLDRDAAMIERERGDVLFAPAVGEMYPPGFQTEVRVRDLSAPLEGAARGTAHFDGVATVVTKLFNIVQPSVAFFGQKDAQQVAVIRRMVTDLSMPVRIVVCPTVRESDGLAMSSRNTRLDANARAQAPAIKHALDAAAAAIGAGERDGAAVAQIARRHLAGAGITPEYCEVVSPVDLRPAQTIAGEVLVAIAARVGGVRLIDNVLAPVAEASRR